MQSKVLKITLSALILCCGLMPCGAVFAGKLVNGNYYCVGSDGKVDTSAPATVNSDGTFTCPDGSVHDHAYEHRSNSSGGETSGGLPNTAIINLSGCTQNPVICVVELGMNIMSVVAGILVVIGIVVVGIQYMTAGGNEAQLTKAKRRMLEIVIGAVLYACLYPLAHWFLGGSFI